MKFITLSIDPESYGSEFKPADLSTLNDAMRGAAVRAGVDVIEGFALSNTEQAEERTKDGDTEINWFEAWCEGGIDAAKERINSESRTEDRKVG